MPYYGDRIFLIPVLSAFSFLYQLDRLGEQNYTPSPVLEKALDVLFLLHADRELNASCTTVLQTGSSLVDPYSAIAYVPHNKLAYVYVLLIGYITQGWLRVIIVSGGHVT